MIESIEFKNFKALRDTTLPLAPFTLLLGPNGSGKSSVLQALQLIVPMATQGLADFVGEKAVGNANHAQLMSKVTEDRTASIQIDVRLRYRDQRFVARFQIHPDGRATRVFETERGKAVETSIGTPVMSWLSRLRIFALDSSAIAVPSPVNSQPLQASGQGLAAVLDDLKDNHPERWDSLLAEMRRWLPEYDYIQFDKPDQGQKVLVLRTRKGGHRIEAKDLSHGTLVALALLTLAYLPNPPSIIGLEEIDRGLHPRLLRHLQDALYRLSYPESCGEKRPAIQVIATTHSPYLLDLYRDHPEEVVLAQKEGLEVTMRRLSDVEHLGDILGESPLSEVWYSGVLGGVAVKP